MPLVARFSADIVIRLTTAIVVLFSAWLLAHLTWMLVEPDSVLPAPAVLGYPTSSNEPGAGRPGFRELAVLSVLGRAPAADGPVVVNAPDTKLSWTLKGVLSDPDPKRSAAILATQGQPEKLYRVGAELPGQVRLDQVLSDRVMLVRDGQLETLRLKRHDVGSSVRSAGRQAALPTTNSNLTLAPDGGVARIDRSAWLNDPQRFMEVISATPVMVDGGMYGLEVSPSRNVREFEAAGLQSGDVITDVDGTPISDIEDYRDILKELSDASSVSISLERDGEPMNITITMD
ncbi:type II secretion system protein GspC [Pseudomonas sp. 5Ae-yellow]|uniref:type II secretion system protein GspC n=1 Tax=Pseudomonas sp. 5Ae-yellow TaxID=2759848 RepID=UPI0015F53D37|nr:type II secretion system protein GspC [Pseudomonas sp. 5Ae-yellow]MBA6418991.1 type II secretion system protein GspC [Pseudomonas sp. 5Ae-yellow]